MKRRFFLLAAPAIVAAPSLMRVSAACMPVNPAPYVRWAGTNATFYAGYEIVPQFAEVVGDRLYFVNPARYAYTINGKTLSWAEATEDDRRQGVIHRIA